MKIVTADQMREIERRAEAAGVTTGELMEHAGRSVATEAERCLADPRGKRVLVLIGPGNNGGDGLVAARHLHDAGAQVVLYLWARDVARDGHYQATQQRAIPTFHAGQDAGLAVLHRELVQADLIVDALLGTGRARPAAGLLIDILDAVNRERRPGSILLAVDLPTGLNADTGAVDQSCLRADVTITLGFPKLGLFAFPGASHVGRLVIGDIGLPPGIASYVDVALTTPDAVLHLLPPRPPGAHKGTFGKVMVAGGSPNYIGAPSLACIAAGRVGAGLVTLACAGSLHAIFAAKLTETTFALLPEATPGVLGGEAVAPLLRQLAGYNVLLLGPGLGRAGVTLRFVPAVLSGLHNAWPVVTGAIPDIDETASCVVDADGLNALSEQREWWTAIPKRTILTPHSGEMARLLQVTPEEVNADRLGKARGAAARWGTVVVLKGAFTIVAAPDGRANVNPSANPAMATAGTGDVLAGAIAGLLAQGLEPFTAAVVGAYLHARAGEMAAAHFGDAGLLAGDLLPLLPQAIREARASSPS